MIAGHYLGDLLKIAIVASIVMVSSAAYAALNDLGDGQVEDTTQNLVWLKDGNAFKTLCDANDPIATGFTPVSGDALASICFTGRMTWEDAEAWVARLNSESYLGFTDWRQPAVSQPDPSCSLQFSASGFIDQGYGTGCMGSEISRLYIDELTLDPGACPGGVACFQDSAPFVDIGIFYYWTGTPVLSFPNSSFSLSTSANTGEQLLHFNGSRWFVWPVRALLPQVRASLGGHALEEGARDGRVAIIRTGSTTAPLTVNLSITDDGATSGVDYVAIPNLTTITIPAGSDTADFFVTPIDDAVVEASFERVTVTITPSVSYTILSGSDSVGLRIIDNDGAPVVSITAVDQAAEPATNGTFSIARLGGSTALPLAVNIAVLGGTAQNGIDYTALPATVTIPANSQTATVVINVIDDGIIEPAEVVKLDIAAAGGGEYTLHSTANSATLTITDDDVLAVVSVVANDSAASEVGPDTGQFTVSRTGSTVAALIVNIGTSGAATGGSDYVAIPATVTIPAGASEVTVDLVPIDDVDIEGNETVFLSIGTAPSGEYSSGGATGNAQIVIADNDVGALSSNPIPTLSAWTLTLLSLLLAFIAVPMLRVREQ